MAARLATLAEIRALSPTLSSTYPGAPYPDALLEVWSEVAAGFIGLGAWSTDASAGHALLTAHLASMAVTGAFGPSGPMTSRSVSGTGEGKSESRNYGTADSDFARTSYGAAYMAIRSRVLARVGTLIVANSSICQ